MSTSLRETQAYMVVTWRVFGDGILMTGNKLLWSSSSNND